MTERGDEQNADLPVAAPVEEASRARRRYYSGLRRERSASETSGLAITDAADQTPRIATAVSSGDRTHVDRRVGYRLRVGDPEPQPCAAHADAVGGPEPQPSAAHVGAVGDPESQPLAASVTSVSDSGAQTFAASTGNVDGLEFQSSAAPVAKSVSDANGGNVVAVAVERDGYASRPAGIRREISSASGATKAEAEGASLAENTLESGEGTSRPAGDFAEPESDVALLSGDLRDLGLKPSQPEELLVSDSGNFQLEHELQSKIDAERAANPSESRPEAEPRLESVRQQVSPEVLPPAAEESSSSTPKKRSADWVLYVAFAAIIIYFLMPLRAPVSNDDNRSSSSSHSTSAYSEKKSDKSYDANSSDANDPVIELDIRDIDPVVLVDDEIVHIEVTGKGSMFGRRPCYRLSIENKTDVSLSIYTDGEFTADGKSCSAFLLDGDVGPSSHLDEANLRLTSSIYTDAGDIQNLRGGLIVFDSTNHKFSKTYPILIS